MGALTAPDVARVQAALARLDTATVAERIEPDSYLGTLVGALREVVEVLNARMGPHAAQLRALVGEAKAAADACLAVVKEETEALRVERARIERFIEAARVQLGEKETQTVAALVDGVADKLQGATVIKAKAYSRTSHLPTSAAFAGAALVLLAAGAVGGASLSGPPAPSDMWEQCLRTARKDPSTGDVYCAMRVPRRPSHRGRTGSWPPNGHGRRRRMRWQAPSHGRNLGQPVGRPRGEPETGIAAPTRAAPR